MMIVANGFPECYIDDISVWMVRANEKPERYIDENVSRQATF